MGQQQSPIGTTGITGPAPTIQQASATTNKGIQPFYVGGGATANAYEQMIGKEYQGIEGRTTNRFTDMFNKYVDVANREAGRQAGQIGETLGSRGALYSSANLQQQADLRQRTAQDIAAKGAEFQTQLETQRQNAMQNVLSNQAGVAQAEYGAREAAMARAYQDFIRRSDVPPFASSGIQWGSTRPSSGTMVS